MFVHAHTDIVLVKMVLSITLQQTYSLARFLNSFEVKEQKECENKGEPSNQAGLLPVQKQYWKKAHKDLLSRDLHLCFKSSLRPLHYWYSVS